jgi:hypothetical protein
MSRHAAGRTLVAVGGLLLLGLLTTLAVAWGLAAWLPDRSTSGAYELIDVPRKSRIDYVEVVQISRTGMVRREWYAHVPWRHASVHFALEFSAATQERQRFADHWGGLGALVRGRSHIEGWGLEDARGWPLQALWCSFKESGHFVLSVSGGIPLSDEPANARSIRSLPLRPIWRGLMVNTLFYAALWAMVVGLVWWRPMRRRHRRSRGLCGRCGYDMRGIAGGRCPECGDQST